MRRIYSETAIVVLAIVMMTSGAAGVSEETGIPLAEQIDGLPAQARIAYLRHLISNGRDDAEVFFQLAISFHGQGEADSAVAWYEATIARDPRHYKSYVNLGVLYDEQQRARLAENCFRKAVDLKPDDLLANSHLAFMLLQRKEYEIAWEHLARALEIDPDHPQPRYYLAIFFWENRMYREALLEWENVATLDPEGHLGKKAGENIIMLQKALNNPAQAEGEAGWDR
ncbi:MAG: tetratricopeptide repeat protein [Candidatus Krumholzibacteriota bacterium]|nr:tetratricopeptide repeat protein [Candidatus Krumholzibacteriota bacterium]